MVRRMRIVGGIDWWEEKLSRLYSTPFTITRRLSSQKGRLLVGAQENSSG